VDISFSIGSTSFPAGAGLVASATAALDDINEGFKAMTRGEGACSAIVFDAAVA
jgi:hypothetical protein